MSDGQSMWSSGNEAGTLVNGVGRRFIMAGFLVVMDGKERLCTCVPYGNCCRKKTVRIFQNLATREKSS